MLAIIIERLIDNNVCQLQRCCADGPCAHGAPGDGYIVVGSNDGQIRLYSDKSLSRANTAIPGLGAPITAVDVTYDGKWVLATTNNYLMVVKTTYKVRRLSHSTLMARHLFLACLRPGKTLGAEGKHYV